MLMFAFTGAVQDSPPSSTLTNQGRVYLNGNALNTNNTNVETTFIPNYLKLVKKSAHSWSEQLSGCSLAGAVYGVYTASMPCSRPY